MQMLHHSDAIAALDHGRGAGGSGGNWQDGDYQGPGQGSGHHGVRVQLLRADGLQVLWQHLQGTRPSRRLGLFRRVQPHLRRGQ